MSIQQKTFVFVAFDTSVHDEPFIDTCIASTFESGVAHLQDSIARYYTRNGMHREALDTKTIVAALDTPSAEWVAVEDDDCLHIVVRPVNVATTITIG